MYFATQLAASVLGDAGITILIGFTVVFLVLLLRLLKVSEYLPGTEEKLVVTGVFAWVMAHTVVNVAAMTGLIPLTGITLPLLSYGGTSMIFVSFALGLTLQLSCYTGREVINEDISSRRGERGTHYASRRRGA